MYPLNSIPGRKDVAFIKAKHGKGAAQNGRHSGSCAQAPTSRWKQVLLTLLIFIALLALIGGALWHLREYGQDNCELVQDIHSLAPDLILLGGDLVTYGEGSNYDNMLSLCSQLNEIAPVCGVLGNHEDELYFLDGDQALVEKFTAAGVTILRNEEARYTVRDNVISILGVEGSPEDFYNYGASTFMDSVEPQTDYDLRICLAHVPTYFPEHLENYSFELGLAGHTHGGIVRLPKIGPLYSAEEGFLPDYAGGSYELANNATLIVSRGLGDSSWVPRINNVPELSVIDID